MTAPGLASPYPKAPLGARFLALIADSIIAAALLPTGIMLVAAAAPRNEPSIPGLALVFFGALWQLAYGLGRDAFGGAGFGKRLAGLVVVSSTTGSVATTGPAVMRQLVLYALGLIPAIGSLVEPVMVLIDKDGKRLGDKAAKTQVVAVSQAAARGLAVPTGKGLAIGALIAALLVTIVGSAIGGVILAREMSGVTTPTPTIEMPEPTTEEPVEVPAAEEEAPAQEEPPAADGEPFDGAPVAGAVNPETAVDAVGNLLNYLKEDDVKAARAYATRNFQEENDWFFAPAGGALASFEVSDVFADGDIWVVEVDEDWISGPQTSRYMVIEEDNTARVDGVQFQEQ